MNHDSHWGDWELNPCLPPLITELRRNYPGIDIGTIADAHHTPPSDHIPNKSHRVNAIDPMISVHFPRAAADQTVTELIKDHRVKYLIWQRQIWKPATGWKPYLLSDAHTGHFHLSVVDSAYRQTQQWIIERRTVVFTNVSGYLPTLLIGDSGPIRGIHYVSRAQTLLNYLLPEEVTVDDNYGPKTADAVAKVMGGGQGASITVPVWEKALRHPG
jgi:hypothetical protein